MAKPTKKGKESCEIYLYGIIGRGLDIDTNELIREIEARRKDGVRSFTFYVNSDGGEVAQGSALFNYLDRTDVDVTWVVDGIAASMMAVLITNPKHHVKAARHAKFMYHRVCGYVYGNSDETRAAADMMDSFETTLIEMTAARTGLTPEEARSRWFDGVDHWLSAEEAVQAGLCDGIINTSMNIKELENITDARSAFNYYNNQIINLKQQKMLDEKAIATALNISETSTEAEMLDSIKGVVNERTTLRQQLQGQYRFTDGPWCLTTRVILSWFNTEESGNQQGWAVSQEVRYSGDRWQTAVQATWHDINGYYARIYLSESYIQYAYSMPMLQGRGLRTSVVLRCDITKWLNLNIKYTLAFRPGEDHIGSDNAATPGPVRQTWHIQLRCKF